MSSAKPETAIILTNGFFERIDAKTAHGMVRGPSRYRIAGIVDAASAGSDAGELLDGHPRAIPIAESVPDLLSRIADTPGYCVVGVATKGGVVPPSLRRDLLDAAQAGMSLVNGLHESLASDPELAALVERHGGRILDIRAPRSVNDLRFWTGEVFDLPAPRVAVLGTDCALGKRTTCNLLERELGRLGVRAGMVYTGQTGWLQGRRHGFIFDATPNDFVPGELEGAILDCFRDEQPDVILLEGQSGLRNPSGPCGSELIVSAGAAGVVLQHAPGRAFFKGFEKRGARVPPLSEELELVRLLGSQVWAIGLHEEGLTPEGAASEAERLERELGVPVTLPAREPGRLVATVRDRLSGGTRKGS
jgi:uncharacterized NAD-dependent epimerase/dehydratase family protein